MKIANLIGQHRNRLFIETLACEINQSKNVDLIFCTADSITLGCLDALGIIAMANGWKDTTPPKVIGHDGVNDVRDLCKNSLSPLVRVVVQDAREVAEGAVKLLLEMLKRDLPDCKRVCKVKPYLYPISSIILE